MIRVLIADDQLVIRSGFRLFLEPFDDIDVVGEATSGDEAVALARELHADVVLMDVRMPGGDGLAATRALAGPGVADPVSVIMVTTFEMDEYLFGSLEAGAVGFLLKDTDPEPLADAIRVAAGGGGSLASGGVTRRLIEEFARQRAESTAQPDAGASPHAAMDLAELDLTTRELDIIRALARGMNNTEIGEHLHLEPSTVKSHLSRVNAKLGTRDRVQTVVWAFRHGLVS